jgi:hypothetical protein
MIKKIFIAFIISVFISTYCYAEKVLFNTKTHKYHIQSCNYAIKCTVNCIKIEKQEAKARGGIPCKVCGGG